MSYRPITDVWILARPKVKYYGAYPSGFLERARALLGVSYTDSVLHVCSGRVRDYPFRGLGPNDKTLDLDPANSPDYCCDARDLGAVPLFDAVLTDPPYTEQDAKHYAPGADVLPEPTELLQQCLRVAKPGGRVGVLHYLVPRPPKGVRFVALVAVSVGFGNRMRAFSVFERPGPNDTEERARALAAVRGQT